LRALVAAVLVLPDEELELAMNPGGGFVDDLEGE